jgi:hypothetical protein
VGALTSRRPLVRRSPFLPSAAIGARCRRRRSGMAQREAGAAAGGARMAEGGAQRNAIGLTHTEAGRVVLAIWDGLRLKVTRGEETQRTHWASATLHPSRCYARNDLASTVVRAPQRSRASSLLRQLEREANARPSQRR